MKTRMLDLWDSLRSSYWFLPTVMSLLAIVFAGIMLQIDRYIPNELLRNSSLVYTSDAGGERSLLLTIAGSMVAIIGIVFSVTMVPLTIAASQFGPRLLRNYLRDTTTQVVIGSFAATFVYCMVVLLSIPESLSDDTLPQISATVALVLALISIGVLLYFLHHIAVSLQATSVVAEVSAELHAAIEHVFRLPGERQIDRRQLMEAETLQGQVEREGQAIQATKTGYIRAIAKDSLVHMSAEQGLFIALQYRPGDFVVSGCSLAYGWPAEKIDDQIIDMVNQAFLLGEQRTLTQDVEFGINSLVEVGVRALSPAINDPFTAMTCLDRIGAALALVVERIPEPFFHCDHNGRLCLFTKPFTFQRLADSSFNLIRQYGRSNAEVLLRMLDAIAVIATHSYNPRDRAVLLIHASLIEQECKLGLPNPGDRERVERRFAEVAHILTTKHEGH